MTPLPWHRAALQALATDRARLPHALLLHGAAGIGKAEFARALAASVLCETPRSGLACGQCPSCHWFDQGNHPDYREVVPEIAAEEEPEAEGEAPKAEKAKSLVIKIDQVRALADFVSLTTHRGGLRVLVIRPAETLAPAAANALLKTLEEPPAHTLIVLVSDKPARLLPTIRSRCRMLRLTAPAPAEALAWLESQGVDEARVALAAAGGAPLLAQALAQPERAEFRKRVVTELSRPSGADPVQFAAGFDRAAVEPLIYWMQTWLHDLVRVRLSGPPRHHVGQGAALASRAREARLDDLFALDAELASARSLASHPLNPRLLAEHLLMAYNRATLGSHS